MQIFYNFLQRFVPYDQIAFEAFCSLLQQETKLPKKEFLLQDGDRIKYLYFVKEGNLRGFYVNGKGDEITSSCYIAPILFTDNYAYANAIATQLNVQAVSDVLLYKIELTEVEKLVDKYMTINSFFRLYFSFLFNINYQRQLSFIYDSAEERYTKLIAQRPKVIDLFPQHYIASYLGMKPETLSRIRKKMAKRK